MINWFEYKLLKCPLQHIRVPYFCNGFHFDSGINKSQSSCFLSNYGVESTIPKNLSIGDKFQFYTNLNYLTSKFANIELV